MEFFFRAVLCFSLGTETRGIEMVSLILILTIRGSTLFKLSTKMCFSLPLSLHPTMEIGKEKEKDCVQIKCKDSVKM